jgi:TRAP-type C4-dicarboxylate transport system permease large subunit
MVLLIIGTAAAFSWLMAFLRMPATLVAWMQTISDNPIIILLLLNLIMLVLGTFMDMGPTIIITTPIFLPIVQAYGIDPVHFGVIMILNYSIGLNTPPVGRPVRSLCRWQNHRLGGDAFHLALLRGRSGRPVARHIHSGAVALVSFGFQIVQ